jgi:hypothetical protein
VAHEIVYPVRADGNEVRDYTVAKVADCFFCDASFSSRAGDHAQVIADAMNQAERLRVRRYLRAAKSAAKR